MKSSWRVLFCIALPWTRHRSLRLSLTVAERHYA